MTPVADIVDQYMQEITKNHGRESSLYYYGQPEAEKIIVAMASVTGYHERK
jgi:pyruvate/2-oxoacid:ferredoxin oxidoreductase alpha subunit